MTARILTPAEAVEYQMHPGDIWRKGKYVRRATELGKQWHVVRDVSWDVLHSVPRRRVRLPAAQGEAVKP